MDLKNLFRVSEIKPIEITIPNQLEKLKIKLLRYENHDGYYRIQISLLNRDKFKHFTLVILKHYINKNMEMYLTLYSINPDKVSFQID